MFANEAIRRQKLAANARNNLRQFQVQQIPRRGNFRDLVDTITLRPNDFLNRFILEENRVYVEFLDINSLVKDVNEWLRNEWNNRDLNNPLTAEERLKMIRIDNAGPLDLNHFTNLKDLSCVGIPVTELSIDNCRFLETIFCSLSQLDSLKIENFQNLRNLKIAGKPQGESFNGRSLRKIEITNNPNLERIVLRDNYNLKEINLSDNPRLRYLDLRNSGLKASNFDLSKLSEMKFLEYLNIEENDLSFEDFKKLEIFLKGFVQVVKEGNSWFQMDWVVGNPKIKDRLSNSIKNKIKKLNCLSKQNEMIREAILVESQLSDFSNRKPFSLINLEQIVLRFGNEVGISKATRLYVDGKKSKISDINDNYLSRKVKAFSVSKEENEDIRIDEIKEEATIEVSLVENSNVSLIRDENTIIHENNVNPINVNVVNNDKGSDVIRISAVIHEKDLINLGIDYISNSIYKAIREKTSYEDGKGVIVSLISCGTDEKDVKERGQKLFENLELKKGDSNLEVIVRNGLLQIEGKGHKLIERGEKGLLQRWREKCNFLLSPSRSTSKKSGYFKTGQKYRIFRPSPSTSLNSKMSSLSSLGMMIEEVQEKNRKENFHSDRSEQLNEMKLAIEWSKASSLTEKFEKLSDHLIEENKLSEDFKLSIKTLKIDETGEKSVQFVNIKDEKETHLIKLKDDEFKLLGDFKNYLDEKIFDIKMSKVHNAESPNSLTSAFVVMAIIDYLNRDKSGNANINALENARSYLSASQLLLDTGSNVCKLADILRILDKGAVVEESSLLSNVGGHFSTVMNVGLNLAYVALDIKELSEVNNSEQRFVIYTQLTFDSTGLGLGLLSGGLGLAGFATASAFAGYLAAPLAGVGFGAVVLAGQISQAQGEAIEMAKYFWWCENDYNSINTSILTSNDSLLVSLSYTGLEQNNGKLDWSKARHKQSVIKNIDLTNNGKLKLTLDSQFVYETNNWSSDRVYFTNSKIYAINKSEDEVNYRNRALNVRDLLKIVDTAEITIDKNILEIILPVCPRSYIDYSYDTTSFLWTHHDAELSSVRKMQTNGRFIFEYDSGIAIFHFAIRSLKFEYVESPIEINLGESDCHFSAPQIPVDWKDKVSYNFKNGIGKYALNLDVGSANCVIENSGINSVWNIDAGNYSLELQKDNKADQINILLKNGDNTTNVIFKKSYPKIVSIKSEGLIQEFDLSKFQSSTQDQIYDQMKLKSGYVMIENHDSGSGIIKKCWYDAEGKKYFYPIIDDGNENLIKYKDSKINFLGVVNDEVYYFLPDNQVILYQEKVSGKTKEAINNITNAYINNETVFVEYKGFAVLILEKDKKSLLRLGLNSNTPKEFLEILDNKEKLKGIIKENNWSTEKFVIIYDDKNEECKWYDNEIDEILILNGINAINFRPIAWKKEKDVIFYFFYNSIDKNIYWQVEGSKDSKISISNIKELKISENIVNLSVDNGNVIATSQSGLLFKIDEKGDYALTGITDNWLKEKSETSFWSSLEELIDSNKNHESKIVIIGNGWNAYYDVEKQTIIDLGSNHNLINYDEEKKRTYFFDKKENKIFYQSTEEGDVRNYVISKDSDGICRLEKIGFYQQNCINVPINCNEVFLDKNGKMNVKDLEDKSFVISEDSDNNEWDVEISSLGKLWFEKHKNSLKDDLKKIVNSDLYDSKEVISLDYNDGNKGWYNKYSEELISFSKPNSNNFDYLAFDKINSKIYLLDIKTSKIVEGDVNNGIINSIQDTHFKDFKTFGKTIYLKPDAEKDINIKIPSFDRFNSILINGDSNKKTYLIDEKNISNYFKIVFDFSFDNGEMNEINLDIPYDKFEISWQNSDYILEYDFTQIVITGYEKNVKLSFREDNLWIEKSLIISHNEPFDEKPNIVEENSISTRNKSIILGGGNLGTDFEDSKTISDKIIENEKSLKSISISKIEIRTSKVEKNSEQNKETFVNSIKSTYKVEKNDGSSFYIEGEKHGGDGGDLSVVEIKENEIITKIIGWQGWVQENPEVKDSVRQLAMSKLNFDVYSSIENKTKTYECGVKEPNNNNDFVIFQEEEQGEKWNFKSIFGKSGDKLYSVGVYKKIKEKVDELSKAENSQVLQSNVEVNVLSNI